MHHLVVKGVAVGLTILLIVAIVVFAILVKAPVG
jgi:hypothetical protein